MHFRVDEHSTNVFHGYRGHAEKNDSFVLESAGSSVVSERSFIEEVTDS
jgi:hypothetical protein